MLFHEIYGSYYQAAAAIIKEAERGTLNEKKMYELVSLYAFGESLLSIPDGMKGEKWKLIRRDMTTPLLKDPDLPLSTIEKRWMKSLLLDPRIKLFDPDFSGLEDVEPFFTPDMCVYYDRYTDGDDYSDPVYIRNFRTILQALRNETNLHLTLDSKREIFITPYYLEYSEKDDRFRLIAGGRKRRRTINLSRVIDCEPTDQIREQVPLREADTATVTFELEDRRNALERVMLHFSHLEKETRYMGGGKYVVTLKYDKQDETEMLIRILSFGPVLKVVEPKSFAELLRDRIEKQKQLASFLP